MFRSYPGIVDGDVDALSRVRDVLVLHAARGFNGIVALAGRGAYTREVPVDAFSIASRDMVARVSAAAKGKLAYAYLFAVASAERGSCIREQLVQGALLSLAGGAAPVVHNVCATLECRKEGGQWSIGPFSPLPRGRFEGEAQLVDAHEAAEALVARTSQVSLDRPSSSTSGVPVMKVKVAPSGIAYGVGLFPLQPIPKGETVLHFHWRDHKHTTPIRRFPQGVREYLRSIWSDAVPAGLYFHPVNFLNHSAVNPNVYYDEDRGDYIAARDLTPEDEITIDYRGYNEPRLAEFADSLTGDEKVALETGPEWGW